jgi:N-acyl-D-aspartate/D-glutamate deacylase
MHYDLVLANARVIDPKTHRDGTYHVGITDARIAAVSTDPNTDGSDASDRVAVRFVDTRAHSDTTSSLRRAGPLRVSRRSSSSREASRD